MALTTKKVIDMTPVSSTAGIESKVLYVSKTPSTDENIQFRHARDYFLNEGIVDGEGILAVKSASMSGGDATTTLSFKASELSAVTPVATDYIVIEDVTDNSSKKVLVSAITGMATGTVTSVSGGTNLTASPTTGATIVNLD